MHYISTRGKAPALAFDEVLLAGLARDGGLYVPEAWPHFDEAALRALAALPYAELAAKVMAPFMVGSSITQAELESICADAYGSFDHKAVAPLKQLAANEWVMELFHGPTLAFKDFALQVVGRLFDAVLAKNGRRVCIVGATSGDTGSAAIEACRDREAIDIFILHPQGRVSEVQRRQMTTVPSANVFNLAIEGTFDDCQDMVKALFADETFRDEVTLSAVNSINWARIMAQIVYYFAAALALGAPARKLAFAVPTGNFGNVYSGYAAREMGLPITQLVVGSNCNDILTRFFDTGIMKTETVVPTLSPSMDIQVSSNFERLLFDLLDRDGEALSASMAGFRRDGEMRLDALHREELDSLFAAACLDDAKTAAAIAQIHVETGELLDPHSVIGVVAGRVRRARADIPMVALATAHPAKFPAAVEAATGVHPALPPRLADLFERTERFTVLPNDINVVQAFVRERVKK